MIVSPSLRDAKCTMLRALLFTVLATAPVTDAVAGDYPSRTIKIIVPFSPGGSTDAQARLIARGLAERLGKPVVVDNRPGAGGRIGADLAARAAPDGHTLLIGSISTLAIEPVLHANTSYDPQRDFAPITLISEMPLILVVSARVPAKSVAELIAYGRKTSNLTYASWGSGSSSHLVAELFKSTTQVDMLHVPYKGGAAAIVDMLGGQVSLMFGLPVDTMPHIKAGRLRALAVTGSKRFPTLPNVPTFTESGLSGLDLQVWFGFVVPVGTPSEIRNRLWSEISGVIKAAEFSGWAESQGILVVAGTPESFAQRIQADSALAAKLAKSIALKLDD